MAASMWARAALRSRPSLVSIRLTGCWCSSTWHWVNRLPQLFEPVPGVLPLHDDAAEATRQQEGDQPVVRVVSAACLRAGLAQGRGGRPAAAKVQPSRFQHRSASRSSPCQRSGSPGPGRWLSSTKLARRWGPRSGAKRPARGLQGAHGDIQLLALHECRARAQGRLRKVGPRLPCPGSGGSGSRPARRVRHRPRSGWKGASGSRPPTVSPGAERQAQDEGKENQHAPDGGGVNILLKQCPSCSVCCAALSIMCRAPDPYGRIFAILPPLTGFFPTPCWEAITFSSCKCANPLDCASILSPLLCSRGNRVFSIGLDPVRWHRLSRGAPPQTPAPYP